MLLLIIILIALAISYQRKSWRPVLWTLAAIAALALVSTFALMFMGGQVSAILEAQ